MRQFDVVPNPSDSTKSRAPFLLVLQSHLLDQLNTTLVAPLLRPDTVRPDETIALPVEFDGQSFTLAVALLANIEVKRLGRPIGDLRRYDYEIRRALDRLFTGF